MKNNTKSQKTKFSNKTDVTIKNMKLLKNKTYYYTKKTNNPLKSK